MTLDYYRIFYYVAQYQSFSKAAEILGNNQPNLSRCMNLLESELGCQTACAHQPRSQPDAGGAAPL